MTDDPRFRPPTLSRWLLRAASWLVPASLRPAWRERWDASLRSWWVLVQRGEWISGGPGLFPNGREALVDAVWLRFTPERMRNVLEAPSSVLVALGTTAAVLAVLSRGFSYTRYLIANMLAGRAANHDSLVAHSVALGFALFTAVAFTVNLRLPVHARTWRCVAFFGTTAVATGLLVTLGWIEGSSAIRSSFAGNGPRILFGGLLPTLVYFAALPLAIGWSIADQHLRCPVCLHRLILPVSIGYWSSMIEPPATELMCRNGHGALCVPETESGTRERWTTLDVS